jgi:hypothetical protein
LSEYDESIAAMARGSRAAEQYVHVEFYIAVIGSSNMDIRSFNPGLRGLGDVCQPPADDGYARG